MFTPARSLQVGRSKKVEGCKSMVVPLPMTPKLGPIAPEALLVVEKPKLPLSLTSNPPELRQSAATPAWYQQ